MADNEVSAEVEAAEIARIKAETRKLTAEAAHEEMQTKVQKQQLRFVTAEAERAEMSLAERRIDFKRILAHDTFHHIFRFGGTGIDPTSVRQCINELSMWRRTEPGQAVEIVFESPGGNLFSGLALFDYIQEMRRDGHYVTTSAVGLTASMAAILVQAGDHRVVGKETSVLLHEPSTLAMGKMGEIEDEMVLMRKVQDRILTLFTERSAQAFLNGTADLALSRDQFENGDTELGIPGWHRKEWWLDSSECLRFGIIDEIR